MRAYTKPTGVEFKTFIVNGQADVVADQEADILTLVAGTDISIVTDPATDTITINATGGTGGGGFVSSGDPAGIDMYENGGLDPFDFSSIGNTPDTWYEYDLNSIASVPTDAAAVLLFVTIVDNLVESSLEFRDSANNNVNSISKITTKVIADEMAADLVVPITAGKIDIRARAIAFTDFTYIRLVVKGWWL